MTGLVGRVKEQEALDRLLDTAREGLSGTIVIQGEAGVGKTALIDYAVGRAQDFLVVPFTGLESECALGYAALHRLLTPILHQIERLPRPQRDALNSALGLAAGPPANPFFVGLGTISLAANAARARHRLLTVIDDAHWVDRESLEALAFWGRRIRAEGIALIFGTRDGGPAIRSLSSFDVLQVQGLSSTDATTLMERELASPVDRLVVERIVAETDGNPLALIELAHSSHRDNFAVSTMARQPLPVGPRLEEHFAHQVRALPTETQTLLVLAAADSSGSTETIWRASSILGVRPDAAEPAEAHGLIVVGAVITFRHPLIRSAVYRTAHPAERRAAHRGLAEATGAENAERHAWHRAAAALGPDEQTAALLERCATDAAAKGHSSAAAALLSRAAELTPDRAGAAQRRVAAASAAIESGAPYQAIALVERAHAEISDATLRARALRVHGSACVYAGESARGMGLLLEAARLLVDVEPSMARRVLLEALEAAHLAGRLEADDGGLRDVITAVMTSSEETDSVDDVLLAALAAYLVSGFVAAAPRLRRAIEVLQDAPTSAALVRWNVIVGRVAHSLWSQEAHACSLTRVSELARDHGALQQLALALQALASNAMWCGDFHTAESCLTQASDVLGAIGAFPLHREFVWMDFRAFQGDEDATRTITETVVRLADATELGAAETNAHLALAHYHLGYARYAEAKAHATVVFERDPVLHGNDVLGDLIEAAARTGDDELAARGIARLAERAEATASPWALGMLARCRGLVDAEHPEEQFREAVALLTETRLTHDLARSHLLYGEWLRRQRRRSEACTQLRTAYELFATMGAAGFAQRARDELLATGEHVRRRTVDGADELTPQEAHIARLAASGATNGEIAAQLYISVNTVEYHFRKIFRKLDITSRRDLRRMLR